MRIPAFLTCIVLTAPLAHAEFLTEAERKALIEQLTKIRESADERIDTRYRTAMRAYNQAMGSNEAVIDFYLKCVEKVRFSDQLKDPKEFREWKEKEEATHADPAFKLALRYQLRWLILNLEATSRNADPERLAAEAVSFIDTIYADFSKIETQSSTLKQSVMSSVFAKAYDVDTVETKWPGSPVELEKIYEDIILPPLRRPTRIAALRNAWTKRIQLEKINACSWVNKRTDFTSNGRRDRDRERDAKEELRDERTVNEERFDLETRPELIWKMELDLYQSGDEAGAAARMLAHIQNHLGHASSREWAEQLQNLLSPPPPAEAANP